MTRGERLPLPELLGNLNCVERRALAELIAAHEELKTAPLRQRGVFPNASDEHRVFARRGERHREGVALAIVDDLYAGGLAEDLSGAPLAELVAQRQIDGLRVGSKNGNS